MPPKRKRGDSDDESEVKTKPAKKTVEESDQESEEHDSNNGDENDENDEQDGNENDSEGEGNDSDGDSNRSDSADDDGDDDDDDAPKSRRSSRSAVTNNKKTASKTKPATKKGVKALKAKRSSPKDTITNRSKSSKPDELKIRKPKVIKKIDRLEEARKAYKWWEAPKLPSGVNWRYLEHAGVCFPPAYEPHGIPLSYDNEIITLTPEQEEIATFYASIPEDGPQLGNPQTRSVFQRNFFDDFKVALGNQTKIKFFDKLDFSQIRHHLDLQRSLRKVATTEEKTAKKTEKEVSVLRYGYALIDGRVEKMGNFNMEPPGLFRGRGAHPKTGKMKRRAVSEQVMLNLSLDAPVPMLLDPHGHAWESIRHDPGVTWLAGWQENVQNQNKYVMLAASSSFKGKSDMDKYTKAIKLKSCIGRVRADYTAKIKGATKDKADKQLGTAMWVIDILALRVGGEKGEDEADTVGCCSLRIEHLKFNPDASTYEIELEFLGKDSMLYKQNINFATHGDLGKQVYANLKSFCSHKKPDEDVFDTLDPTRLNQHLSSLMKGLTAKVFRTYNASVTLEKELPSAEEIAELSLQEKVLRYNAANRQVAILCNHQRTVSKATETMFEGLHDRLQMMIEQRSELVKWKELATKGKEDKIPLLKDNEDGEEGEKEDLKEALAAAEQQRETAVTNDQKLAAAKALDDLRAAIVIDKKKRLANKHFYTNRPSVESIEARITRWTEDIRKLETDIRNKEENKEVALGTSKINYMDPRISVAWCKRCEVPIDKIFARTLRDKFNWACAVPPDWKFE